MPDYILEMKNITKDFSGVKALDNVNFTVYVEKMVLENQL